MRSEEFLRRRRINEHSAFTAENPITIETADSVTTTGAEGSGDMGQKEEEEKDKFSGVTE